MHRPCRRIFSAALAASTAMLGGCATFPPDRTTLCATDPPHIEIDRETGQAWTDLSVLTYNIEGLPWPARSSRSPQLTEIGRQLAALRAAGEAPDIVLLQEVFTTDAAKIPVTSDYPNRVKGPDRSAPRPSTSDRADPQLTERRNVLKGERLFRLFSSGLYVLSEFPVIDAGSRPFRKRECAGFDCLANKGLQHVRIEVPGVPQAIDLFNTHLNSARASRAGPERALLAHILQIEETVRYIEEERDPDAPMIFGGDFNMRNDDARLVHFAQAMPYILVHEFCIDDSASCRIAMTWDGDAPWMDTQDLQGFDDGAIVAVQPLRVEAMFDEPWRGAPLADHDGFLVAYRLSWPIQPSFTEPTAGRCVG